MFVENVPNEEKTNEIFIKDWSSVVILSDCAGSLRSKWITRLQLWALLLLLFDVKID